jgi:hypothetical protein
MGADMCFSLFYEPSDMPFKPDWNKGFKAIDSYIKAGKISHFDYISDDPKTLKSALYEKLTNVKNAYENGSRELTELYLSPYKIYVTGGMSWGDAPSDLYTDINDLENIDILIDVGFNEVPDYQKIVENILSKKEILPLLMSINPVLDTLISKEMKKGKGKKK